MAWGREGYKTGVKWLPCKRKWQAVGGHGPVFSMVLADAEEGAFHPGHLSIQICIQRGRVHMSSALLRPYWEQDYRLLIVPWSLVRDVSHWLSNLAFFF